MTSALTRTDVARATAAAAAAGDVERVHQLADALEQLPPDAPAPGPVDGLPDLEHTSAADDLADLQALTG